MRNLRLTATLVAIPLAAVACGTATSSPNAGGPGTATTQSPQSPETARTYAADLLAKVVVPSSAVPTAQAPSKALDGLPESPSLSGKPTVLTKFWRVNQSSDAVYAWLKQHAPDVSLVDVGSAPSTQPGATTQHLSYEQRSLPASIGAGYLYVSVVSTGPSTSAIGAYAVALAQPQRPATEVVPADLSKAVVAWSLAPGGTPALKELTGAAAVRLAADFNDLKVDVNGPVPCPMIPVQYADITVTFTGDGHTWKVDIPACPDIGVTRDGHQLPALSFGKSFLADVKAYTGYLPHAGPPQAPGGAIPLAR